MTQTIEDAARDTYDGEDIVTDDALAELDSAYTGTTLDEDDDADLRSFECLDATASDDDADDIFDDFADFFDEE